MTYSNTAASAINRMNRTSLNNTLGTNIQTLQVAVSNVQTGSSTTSASVTALSGSMVSASTIITAHSVSIAAITSHIGNSGSYTAVAGDQSASLISISATGVNPIKSFLVQHFRSGSAIPDLFITKSASVLSIRSYDAGIPNSGSLLTGDLISWLVW